MYNKWLTFLVLNNHMSGMKKLSIALTLISHSLFVCGQLINEVNSNLGFSVNAYATKKEQGFSTTANVEEFALFVNVLGKKNFSKRVSFDYGFGFNREYLGLNPLIKVSDIIGLEGQDLDALMIAEVANWDWQFLFPLGISYKLFDQINILPPLIILPGMKLNAGIQNRVTFNRINTDNIIISNYDEMLVSGYEYYNKVLNKHVSDYYSDMFKYYKLTMYLGLEFLYKYGAAGLLGGIKFNGYVLSPLNCKIKNKGSLTGYIGLYYELNSR